VKKAAARVLAWDRRVRGEAPGSNATEIARLLRAHAIVNHKHAGLLKTAQKNAIPALAIQARENMNTFMDFIWSFAKLRGVANKSFFKQAARMICHPHVLSKLGPRDAKDASWAFARVRNPHPEVFTALGEHITANLSSFRDKDLIGALWGFGKSKQSHPGLFKAVETRFQNLEYEPFGLLTPLELSILTWAFGRTQFKCCDELSNAVAFEAMTNIVNFGAKELPFLVVGLSSVGLKSPSFYAMADYQAARVCSELTNEQTTSLISSFRRARAPCGQLDEAVRALAIPNSSG